MKSILKFSILIIIAITLSGCKDSNLPLLSKEAEVKTEDEEIRYTIEQVNLSKGYQSIEPNIEAQKKNNKVRLLVSLGLLESSGVQVERIIKRGNTINIHVSNNTEEMTTQLAVPQIFIELKNIKSRHLDEMTFNIVNENYKPLSVKLGLNEIVNKINAEFKVAATTVPTVNLFSRNDSIIWDVTYNSIFDRDNPETPLVNLSVQVDANSGEIIQSSKSFISSYIDGGHTMDYVEDKFILYKKTEIDAISSTDTENLWYYDITKNEKTMVYTSKAKIISASFSPDLNNISLLESSESNIDLYIIPKSDVKAYKVFFQENLNPKFIRWKDKNSLYIVENNGESSNILSYNLKQNELVLISNLEKDIVNFRFRKDNYLISEGRNNEINLKLSYTDDLHHLRFLDFGYNQMFVDDNKVAYLKKIEKEDKDQLYIYDLKDKKQYDNIDLNVSNYQILPDGNILIVEKNQGNNDFTIYEYLVKEKNLTSITKVNSDKVYYNKEKDLIFINLSIPFETEVSEIIYSISLSKLVNLKP